MRNFNLNDKYSVDDLITGTPGVRPSDEGRVQADELVVRKGFIIGDPANDGRGGGTMRYTRLHKDSPMVVKLPRSSGVWGGIHLTSAVNISEALVYALNVGHRHLLAPCYLDVAAGTPVVKMAKVRPMTYSEVHMLPWQILSQLKEVSADGYQIGWYTDPKTGIDRPVWYDYAPPLHARTTVSLKIGDAW